MDIFSLRFFLFSDEQIIKILKSYFQITSSLKRENTIVYSRDCKVYISIVTVLTFLGKFLEENIFSPVVS